MFSLEEGLISNIKDMLSAYQSRKKYAFFGEVA